MQCFGGLFRPHIVHRSAGRYLRAFLKICSSPQSDDCRCTPYRLNLHPSTPCHRARQVQNVTFVTLYTTCSIAGVPGTALSTSEEASAATCSSAACAQSAQQHCTEMRQQHHMVASTRTELPSSPSCEPPPPSFNGSTVADQQAQAAQAVPVPAAITSSMDGFAAAHQLSDNLSTMPRPRQPSVLAEPVLLSVPPLTAAQTSGGRQTRSAMAMEVMTQEIVLFVISRSYSSLASAFTSLTPAYHNRICCPQPKGNKGVI